MLDDLLPSLRLGKCCSVHRSDSGEDGEGQAEEKGAISQLALENGEDHGGDDEEGDEAHQQPRSSPHPSTPAPSDSAEADTEVVVVDVTAESHQPSQYLPREVAHSHHFPLFG